MDMTGNVWEWQANYSSDKKQYLGLRGGSWSLSEDYARVAFRYDFSPHYRSLNFGFRVVSALPNGRS
jgi:formylglycine-generating enzyme required for sulfatase activity